MVYLIVMNYRIKSKSLIFPIIIGALAWYISQNTAVGIAVFAILMMPAFISLYIPYAKDNPKHLWFKRKLYGWGWTPVTWQGWLVTFIYIALLILFAMTIDENSPAREVVFTFILPATLLTLTFLRIAYKKGERPAWQWGRGEK